jgi:hypothetical protein
MIGVYTKVRTQDAEAGNSLPGPLAGYLTFVQISTNIGGYKWKQFALLNEAQTICMMYWISCSKTAYLYKQQ